MKQLLYLFTLLFLLQLKGYTQKCNLKIFDSYLKVDTIPLDSYIVKRIKIQNIGKDTLFFSRLVVGDGASTPHYYPKKLAPNEKSEIPVTMCCRNGYSSSFINRGLTIDIIGCGSSGISYQFYNYNPNMKKAEPNSEQNARIANYNPIVYDKDSVGTIFEDTTTRGDSTEQCYGIINSSSFDGKNIITYSKFAKNTLSRQRVIFFRRGNVVRIEVRTSIFKPRLFNKKDARNEVYHTARKVKNITEVFENGVWTKTESKWTTPQNYPRRKWMD